MRREIREELPGLKLGRLSLWKEIKAKNKLSGRKMSDAIFIAKNAKAQADHRRQEGNRSRGVAKTPRRPPDTNLALHPRPAVSEEVELERFPAKWIPVRVKKTRQNKKELRSDSIGTEIAQDDCFTSPRKWGEGDVAFSPPAELTFWLGSGSAWPERSAVAAARSAMRCCPRA